MAESDPLTAELAAIEYRGRIAYNDYDAPPRKDWDGLLAAVEAVLEVARKLEPQAPSASALEEDRMWVRQQCAEMIREAITRALTGGSDE